MNSKKGPVPRSEVMAAVIDGIKKAQHDYKKMSGVWALEEDSGAEYWTTCSVAKSLWDICDDGCVEVEGRSNSTLSRKRGRAPDATKDKRYDIVLYFKEGHARAIIEIKIIKPAKLKSIAAQKNAVLGDVEKIIAALNASSLRFGVVGYCRSDNSGSSKTAKAEFAKFRESLRADIKSQVRGRGIKLVFGEPHTETEDGEHNPSWSADCFLIGKR